MRLRILIFFILSLPALGTDKIFFYDERTDASGYGRILPAGDVFAYVLNGAPQFLKLDEEVRKNLARANEAIREDLVWQFEVEYESSYVLLDPINVFLWIDPEGILEVRVTIDRFFIPSGTKLEENRNILDPLPDSNPRSHLERVRYYQPFHVNLLRPREDARHPRYLLEEPKKEFEIALTALEVMRAEIHGQKHWIVKVLPEDEYALLESSVPPRFIPLSLLRAVPPMEPVQTYKPLFTGIYNAVLLWDRYPMGEELDATCVKQLSAIIDAKRHVVAQ
jgi:hypothetical protein